MNQTSESIIKKAKLLVEQKRVKKELDSDKRIHYKVLGDTEQHSVIFDKTKKTWECDCPYSTLKRMECSHIVAAKMLG
jgi:hypothetical protein